MAPTQSLVFLAAAVPSAYGMRKGRKAHAQAANATDTSFHVRALRAPRGCEILEAAWGQVHRLALDSVFQSEPTWAWKDVEMDDEHSQEQLLDFWGPSETLVKEKALKACGGVLEPAVAPLEAMLDEDETEVRRLSGSGDSNNRIDVVFMGDGYTRGERERHFEDMQRLTKDMFADETFRQYLPVFNIWGIHVPSQDSGIGYNGRAKNTPFGLRKNGEQHRAVQPSFMGAQRARMACKLADGCDYPSLIANDEFYGGLGGEFVIGTRSKVTGTIVLRHEMGHNFVSVGEEYDNGMVYRGVNSAGMTLFGNPPQNIKWKHWLTEPDKEVVQQKQRTALTNYPWKDMAEGQEKLEFKTDGDYSSWRMTFTVSGYPEEGSLKVFLDGKQLNWKPTRPEGAERPDGGTDDRQFYYFGDNATGLSAGTHALTFESAFAPPAGAPIRQLCSITIQEYGSASEFNQSPGYVGAFPTWSQFGLKSYRPTNEQCLMRNMESTVFCPVCKEGMWLQFLARMTLLDGVEVTSAEGDRRTVQLKAVPLAHLRPEPIPGVQESYEVTWTKWAGGRFTGSWEEQPSLKDEWTFSGTAAELQGEWQATLQYRTSEVRADPRNLLTSTKDFVISA